MTFINEMILAARGMNALVSNDKNAVKFFDNSYYGFIGASIALLISLAISAFLPTIMGQAGEPHLSAFKSIIFAASIYAVQIGAAAIVLNQINRLNALLTFLVADFWTTFFITIIMSIPTLFGVNSSLFTLIIAIVILVVKINILRLLIKLPAMQIIMFFIAQIVAGFVGVIFLSTVFDFNFINNQPM